MRSDQRLFDRQPPHSPEAEMSLLGSVILDPEVLTEVTPIVESGSAFYSEANGRIFDTIATLFDQRRSGDLVQLVQRLRDAGVLDEVGGSEYLLQLSDSVPSATNARHYAEIVRDKARLRQLVDASGEIMWDVYNSGEEAQTVVDRAEQRVLRISESAAGSDAKPLGQLLHEAMDRLSENDGSTITGAETGYIELDRMTAGLQPGELCIIAARPSMGKTALALNLTQRIASRNAVAFFSLEMSSAAVTQRLLSAYSGVDSHRIRTNTLTVTQFQHLIEACNTLAELPIYVDDSPGLSVMSLRAKARRMWRSHGVGCVIIDYLQLMSAPAAQREGRQNEVSLISRQVKALARELNVPVICLSQLNRGAEQREDRRPRMSDLRESGSIEQDADVVMLLHREEYYHLQTPEWAEDNPEKVGLAELILAKQRNGPTGTVTLRWDPATTSFTEAR